MKHIQRQFLKELLIFMLLISTITVKAQDKNSKTNLKIETLHFDFPANGAMSVDKEGNVYVSEYGIFTGTGGNGKRLYKMDSHGILLDSITNLSGPMGSVMDTKGNLYINHKNDTKSGTIIKVSSSGKQTEFAQIKGWPVGMNMDKNGSIYLTNYNSPEIYKIDKNGKVSIFVKDNQFIGTAGMDFDSRGNLIVANFATAQFFSITPTGTITKIAQVDNSVVQGWGIGHITVVDDYIYATGIAVSKIFKISLTGEVEWFAGNGEAKVVDGNLKEASLSNPNGIASDKKRKILYISEYGQKGGIRKIKLN